MKIIALTGKTGAGKSTVAEHLRKMGCFIIDGDKIARQITDKGKPALKQLCDAFGTDIITADGTLDRKVLAQKAFSSPENTALLNSITHPIIKQEFIALIDYAEKEGYKTVIIDAAATLESDCKDLCQKVIVVHAPESIRLERILSRDSITTEQALTRIKAQKSDDYYLSQADVIINAFTPYNLVDQLSKLEEMIQ